MESSGPAAADAKRSSRRLMRLRLAPMKLRKALVTGGAGFVGSHVVDRLLADGAEVVVVDDLSTGKQGRLAGDASLEVLDIAEFEALNGVVAKLRPDAIFHLAAQASVTVSVKDPWLDSRTNVTGTLNVVEAARGVGAPVVYTSTGGALYGDGVPIPTTEDTFPAPVAPYGASKLAGEAYVNASAAAYGVAHTVCRLGNAYGPRQSPHGEAGVVAIFSYGLWAHEPVTLYGQGAPTRDYVHVGDVAEALMRAAGVRGTFHIATGRETSVSEVFEHLRKAADGLESEPLLAPLRDGELERSGLDSTRAEREFGWTATTPLDRGLAETYAALVEEFEAES